MLSNKKYAFRPSQRLRRKKDYERVYKNRKRYNAGYFLIYDTDEEKVLSIEENMFKNDGHGVGIKTASFVIEKGCEAAIGAQPGPKAAVILKQANVKMIVNIPSTLFVFSVLNTKSVSL